MARDVGTEGKLGGQARVEGVSGTWGGLTENVNLIGRIQRLRAAVSCPYTTLRDVTHRFSSVAASGCAGSWAFGTCPMRLRPTTDGCAPLDQGDC